MPLATANNAQDGALDDQTFATLLSGATRRLRGYALRLTGDKTNAEDLLQDTLLRCWRSRHLFEPGSNFAAWASTVMRNGFLSDRRRTRLRADLPEDAMDRLLSVSEPQEWAVHMRDLDWALAELTPIYREAVLLAGDGLTMREAAERIGTTTGTFKSRLSRARALLNELTDDLTTGKMRHRASPPRREARSKSAS